MVDRSLHAHFAVRSVARHPRTSYPEGTGTPGAARDGRSAQDSSDNQWNLRCQAGSLFPALHRMEEAGWLTSAWGESETNRRAKFYRLTKTGKRQLHTEAER